MAGWFRERRWSGVLTNVAVGLSQIPAYLIALFLILLLGYQFGWFPTRGAYDAQYEVGLNVPFLLSMLWHSILPITAIVLVTLSAWVLSTRSLIITLLGEDYLHYAEAKGLRTQNVMRRYGLRNAMLPQATALALTLGAALSGQLLVEVLFVYPGLGELLSRAIQYFDFNAIMGIILLSIFSVMTASLVIDLFIPIIDPRIRTAIQSS